MTEPWIQTDGRPGWDNYYLGLARAAGRRGDCTRSQVGAMLVSRDRRTATPGYNGTENPGEKGCLEGACPRGRLSYDQLPSNNDYSNCISVHAERNALDSSIRYGETWAGGGTMYITRAPCEGCVTEMTYWGVSRVVWSTPTGIIEERMLEQR